MKLTKTSLAICLAAVVGFALGVLLSYPRAAKASGGSVFVKEATVGSYTTVMGSSVIGFSCVTYSGSPPECFIASQ